MEQSRVKYIRIASADEVPSGTMKSFNAEGTSILITNLNGRFYAMGNKCTHAGGDLSKGHLEANIIKCPRHGSQFNVVTGKRIAGPAKTDEPVYEIKVENNNLNIKI
jgi:nitrite reductase/ring-hydroxylating ferredoxin subunit